MVTDPLTPEDLAAMRQRHFDAGGYCGWCQLPIAPDVKWPCDAIRLCDEVERLRGFEATIRRITGLPTDDELIHGSGPEPLGILNAERTP
mgnify:FL=1